MREKSHIGGLFYDFTEKSLNSIPYPSLTLRATLEYSAKGFGLAESDLLGNIRDRHI